MSRYERYPELLGRTITKVTLSDDHETLTLETDKGQIRYEAYGDCCSSTWIEGIDDPEALLGTVMAAEDITMPDGGPSPYCEYPDSVAYYGLKITTEKGRAVIDYRNNSNGYYGGNLQYVPS